MPDTMIAQLQERGDRIVELSNSSSSNIRAFGINDESSEVVFVGRSHAWQPLPPEARQLQSRLLNELESYAPLVETLLRVAPERSRREVVEANETLRKIVDQGELTWYTTPARALADARKGIAKQQQHLESLHDPTGGDPIYVVDASAAIRNPAFDEWTLAEAPRFVLFMTPTLLAELDKLMIAPGEELRRKAESIVKRIKEYGRRGAGADAVTLRRHRSSVRMLAVEPDFSQTLPWLDPTGQDDRLIASALEIIRQHPGSPVTIVTADGNMQHKARHAGVPFVEPPVPTGDNDTSGRVSRPREDPRTQGGAGVGPLRSISGLLFRIAARCRCAQT
jgi:hypothetical protein